MTETTFSGQPTPQLGAGLRAARRMGGNIILRRWAGCWIDFLAMALLFIVPFLVFPDPAPDPVVIAAVVAVIAYFPVTEGLWGRTLGKLITGTVVVDASGAKPNFGAIIVRTLTRLIEANPFFIGALPAGVIALCTKHHQRLGDVLARTYVVPVKLLGEARTSMSRAEVEVFD
ncbi:RDD family protein [Phenylobacterium sp.]|jgi:uncharacterized RDD family membrane protein YckC|uniref:RDD family protein n=1 Tax=Phenylobacterium sp. TaxID=1871053 RepID=UPI002F927111